MGRFLLKLALFIAPLAGGWLYVEWQLRHISNNLTQKRARIEQQASSTRVLVLGASLTYQGVAPSEFDCKGLNLAGAAQSLFLDAEIVRRYVARMPQLRLVIEGVPYGAFELQLGDTTLNHLVYAYWHYLGTRLDGGVSYWDARTFSLVATLGQELVLYQILTGFRTDWADPMDEYGWAPTKKGILNKPGPGELLAQWNINYMHSFMKVAHVPENVQAQEAMLTLLRQRHEDTVFIAPPIAPALVEKLDAARSERTRAIIADLQRRFGVEYRNYTNDPRFDASDFFDRLHLSEAGARKFSRILNEEVVRPRGVCGAGSPTP
jgi:hypothetical protein